jgi:TPR repeat protein
MTMSRHFLNFLAAVAAITLAKGAHAMRLLKLLPILWVCAAGPAVAGPFEDGFTAFSKNDYATAVRLWRSLAEQGNAKAQLQLGMMYDHGYGVPEDYAAAAFWYRKAADQGDAGAQYILGIMYENGRAMPAVPQDYAAAVALFRRGAEQGSASCQTLLGGMYARGQGVPQDFVQAHMWYNLAAARSDGRGADYDRAERDRTAMKMTPAQIAEAQKLAREWKPKPER